MATEMELTRAKARRMSRESLAAEVLRCKDWTKHASRPRDRKRWKQRHDIMHAELLTRIGPDRKPEP